MQLRWWILLSSLLAIFSYCSLYYIYTRIPPNPHVILAGPQLLFLTFIFLALVASAVPVSAYMNYRFANPDWLKRDKPRLAREGIWFGLFGVLLAYLQLIRALNWTIALVLVCVFILIETFFLTRE
jgi:hypothetical protein